MIFIWDNYAALHNASNFSAMNNDGKQFRQFHQSNMF